jgi:hypothetical protein
MFVNWMSHLLSNKVGIVYSRGYQIYLSESQIAFCLTITTKKSLVTERNVYKLR